MPNSKSNRLILVIYALVSVSIVCLLCSCSSNETWQESDSHAGAENSETSSSSLSSSSTESSTLTAHELSIKDARDFADGVAWVSDLELSNPCFDYLIDTDGNILIDCNAAFGTVFASSNISNYCDGSAVLEIGADEGRSIEADYQIIDKSGNIVWSMLKDGKSYAIDRYGKDAFVSIEVDNKFSGNGNYLSNYDYRGYLVVYIDVDTYNFTGTLSGVLNSQGSWVIEPLPLSSAEEVADWQYHTYIMCNGSNLINYRTGEILPIADKVISRNPYYAGEFGGKEAEKIDLWDEYTAVHDGLRYESRMFGEGGASGFLDANENKVLDIMALFPNASTMDENGDIQFNDGYCLLTLSNDGGGSYLTVIDLKGNQLFDPIKYNDHGALYEGAFFYQGNEDGSGYYLTARGERLGNISADEGGDFHDGRAWIVNDGIYSCIDNSGIIVF